MRTLVRAKQPLLWIICVRVSLDSLVYFIGLDFRSICHSSPLRACVTTPNPRRDNGSLLYLIVVRAPALLLHTTLFTLPDMDTHVLYAKKHGCTSP